MKTYDAIIIGGGAGLKIARPAANLGYKIAVIEEDRLGGTCLNKGCIPSKMLIHPADILEQIKELPLFNIKLEGDLKIDFEKLVHYVSQTVDDESQSIYPLLENHANIDLYKSSAHFVDNYTLEVSGTRIKGKKIFIAAGGRPFIPNIEGLKDTPYITSTELLRLEKLPKKVVILGGGYIACELGHYLDAMGVEVHFIVRSKFLKELDTTIQKHFEGIFSKRFKVSYFVPNSIHYKEGKFHIQGDEEIFSDVLLVAASLTPNSDRLSLEKTGVDLDKRGFIKVNERLETSKSSIYAYGDIIGRYMFRHSANFEGEYLLKQHFEKPDDHKNISYPPVPYGVFTWPQIAGVGKTQEELEEEGVDFIVGENFYQNSAMGMALRKNEGVVKLLFDAKNHKLLGGHIVGEQATIMCHMIIAYMQMGATLKDLLETIYIHPALPENIRNAARKAKVK